MDWYTVTIDAEGPEMEEGLLERLAQSFEEEIRSDDIRAPVAAWGGIAGGPGVTMSVLAEDDLEAARKGQVAFVAAAIKADIFDIRPVRTEVMTEAYADAWLERRPPGLVGVSEIARALGVSKQRVSELRRRQDFPKPVAELAAGPVWTDVSLNHFVLGWERRPGRPVAGGKGRTKASGSGTRKKTYRAAAKKTSGRKKASARRRRGRLLRTRGG